MDIDGFLLHKIYGNERFKYRVRSYLHLYRYKTCIILQITLTYYVTYNLNNMI